MKANSSQGQRIRFVLSYLRGYAAEHGYAPTYVEIAEAVTSAGMCKSGTAFSKSQVRGDLQKLAALGKIEFCPNRARAVAVLPSGSDRQGARA